MDYKLEVKPFTPKEGVSYRIIEITDTAVHTAAKTPTPSLGKKIEKAFEANEPSRLYFSVDPLLLLNGRDYILNQLQRDSSFKKMVQGEEARGWKVVISIPNGGIPVGLGKDAVEFLNSKNGKRILRAVAKKECQDYNTDIA